MLTKIDKTIVKALRPEIKAALKEFEEKFGLVVDPGNSSLNSEEFSMNITFRLKDLPPAQESAYNKYRLLYGLPELGTKFNIPGQGQYEISGFNPQATKNKIIIKKSQGGKEFVCAPDYVMPFLPKKA